MQLQHATLESYVLNNLAELRRDEGRFEEAAELYEASIVIKRRMDNTFGLAHSYASRTDLYLFAGQPAEAIRSAEKAVALRVPAPDPVETARLLFCEARARFAAGGSSTEAVERFQEAAEDFVEADVKGELALATWWQAAAHLEAGETSAAAEAAGRTLEVASRFRLEYLLAPHAALFPHLLEVAGSDPEFGSVAATLAELGGTGARRGSTTGQPATPPALRAALLGNLRVHLEEKEVPLWTWRSKKAVSLFAMLLHHGGDPVHREQAMESLWPEGDPQRARKNLNVALTTLRRGLEAVHPDGALCIRRQGAFYRITPEAIEWIDTAELDALCRRVEQAAESGDLKQAVLFAQQALELATGSYLASEPYAEWAAGERRRIADAVWDLWVRTAEWRLQLGEEAGAAECARRAVDLDPLRERGWHALMRAQLIRGDRAAALKTFEECGRSLQEGLGVGPSADLVRLAESLRR